MLIGQDITKEINGQRILQGVSVKIDHGQAVAVVGPNGAGKSVLLRALSLVDPPTTGRIQVDEEIFSFPSETDVWSRRIWPSVTVVFQQLFLWPHLTLRQNVLLPLRKLAIFKTQIDHLSQMSKAFQLDAILDRYPNEVSIGQRQRTALLRAILLRPKWLFLDEVTSALDLEQTQRVIELLNELKREGVGILLITHMFGFASKIADNAIFLEGGSVIESGDASILTHPHTERMARFVALVEPQ